MAIAFSYTESTNLAVATGGTSGTPATFADFVTADRAGTATDLLLATAGLANNTLTYAVRPVGDLAILVKCIVAAKTAEADFIFITGTDAWDAAQTESLDVTAGNGTYTTTKRWRTITNLDCSDNANGGGTVWADGTIQVTQDVWGVIWDYGNGQYKIDCHLDIGDGSTATYFLSTEEQITFSLDKLLETKASAMATFGEKIDSESTKNGSVVSFIDNGADVEVMEFYGTLNLYGSRFVNTSSGGNNYTAHRIALNGSGEFINSTIKCRHSINFGASASYTSNNFIIEGVHNGIRFYGDMTLTGMKIMGQPVSSSYAIYPIAANITLYLVETRQDSEFFFYQNNTLTNIQMYIRSWDGETLTWKSSAPGPSADSNVYQQYPVSIHVVDKDGANLSEATVLCEDTNDAQAFSVSTAADGTITQQWVSWKTYDDNDFDSGGTEKSPHKFTISKAGYETLTLENITVDGPIDWHLELQDVGANPHPIVLDLDGNLYKSLKPSPLILKV